MRILCTGGAGYLGSVLVPELLRLGHHVTVLDTFASGEVSLAQCCADPKFHAMRGDVRSMGVVLALLEKADVIIPLAALVGAPICARDRLGATTINRDAIVGLVQRASPQQLIIYPNSNSGYGIGASNDFCTEDSPLNPVSLYGRTKCDAEKAVLDHPNSVVLRLATVFGMSPRMRLDLLVNDFTYRAVNDKAVVLFEAHFRRNYIHVRDVAKAFIHAIDNAATMRGLPYNVGLSDANLTKRELCGVIAKYVPGFQYLEAPIGEDPDKRDYLISNKRIEATGWRPDHSLDSGIQELIKGYQMLRNSRYSNV